MVPKVGSQGWQMLRLRDECRDPWFSEELARARAGDESAYLKIYGSCLRIPLRLARDAWTKDCPLSLEELVREGNSELMRTLRQFTGRHAVEFVRQVEFHVGCHFACLLNPASALIEMEV